MENLHPWHVKAGGVGAGWAPTGCPVASYGDVTAEVDAGRHGALFVDRSGCARLQLTGPDRRELLQRLTTQDVAKVPEGQGIPTVFITEKGRVVDRVVLHAASDGDLLLGSADRATRLTGWIQRFIIREEVQVWDLTPTTTQIDVMGPRALEVLGVPAVRELKAHELTVADLGGISVLITRADPVAGMTLRLVVPAPLTGHLLDTLVAKGAKPGGSQAYNVLRLEAGLPLYGPELNEEHNPLESGLVDALHFGKGCYVGQEVVLRVDTYMKQRRFLVAAEVEGPAPEPGTTLKTPEGGEGAVTSSAELGNGRSRLMGYVRAEKIGVGQTVEVVDLHGNRTGTVMPRPAQAPAAPGAAGNTSVAVA